MIGMFKAGYKAYVNGGRRKRLISKTDRHKKEYYDGYEPFDYLTDEQKSDWMAGVQYGINERNECRQLTDKLPPAPPPPPKEKPPKPKPDPKPTRAEFRKKIQSKIQKLLWKNLSLTEIAKRVGVSRTFINASLNSPRNIKLREFRKTLKFKSFKQK